jgi:hypothetical protein
MTAQLRVAAVSLFVICSLVPTSAVAGVNPFKPLLDLLFGKPSQAPSAKQLARSIDEMERCLDRYGTVVAKQPDIWGEARLTKYRSEFEQLMNATGEDNKFEPALQAYINRNDSAYFADAFALAYGGGGGVKADDFSVVNSMVSNPTDADQKVVPRTEFPSSHREIFSLKPKEGAIIGLEPTEISDQKAHYIKHLNAIRRISDGDDTSDSPGYAMYLVRIPISVLPGTITQEGYGAEAVCTIAPYIDDDLLPLTFRNLVVNDVVDALTLPIVRLSDPTAPQKVKDFVKRSVLSQKLGDLSLNYEELKADTELKRFIKPNLSREDQKKQVDNLSKSEDPEIRSHIGYMSAPEKSTGSSYPTSPSLVSKAMNTTELLTVSKFISDQLVGEFPKDGRPDPMDVRRSLRVETENAYELLSKDEVRNLWKVEDHKVPRDIEFPWNSVPVGEVKIPSFPCFMRELALAVRASQKEKLKALREFFFNDIDKVLKKTWLDESTESLSETVTGALAWAIVVESALLDEHLKQDIRNRNYRWIPAEGVQFYGPDPRPAARQMFIDYVRSRWPMHVFALDPVIEEQNVADSFSMRRELQLAAALAFTRGNLSASNLTRFVRRMEMDMDTIALNRTVVGFSHGGDTFGWKFNPRVQTPPTEGNVKVFYRDLLRGGPTREELKNRTQLESGIRECEAVVLMPSFVPYATLDVRSDWFQLTKPDRKVYSLETSLDLSQCANAVRNYSLQVRDWPRYLKGDQYRLLRQLDQLVAQLPLQSYNIQVPFENTLGGFEMFTTGVTDLAPEVSGYYGAPGINENGPTTLFLVGDNFSIHETRVIAGNQPVDFKIISRQILQVTIPGQISGPVGKVLPAGDGRHVHVHVATPYGVSAPLDVPVIREKRPEAPKEEGFDWVGVPRLVAFVRPQASGNSVKEIIDGFESPPPAVSLKNLSDDIEPTFPIEGKVGFRIEKVDSENKEVLLGVIDGDDLLGVSFKDGVARIPFAENGLASNIKTVVDGKLNAGHDVKLKLYAFLNFENPGLPVNKVVSPLEVEIVFIPEKEDTASSK